MRNHYSLLLFFKSFWKLDVWIYNHSIMWETNIEVTELNILIFTNSHPYPRVITNTICKILLMLYKEKKYKEKNISILAWNISSSSIFHEKFERGKTTNLQLLPTKMLEHFRN